MSSHHEAPLARRQFVAGGALLAFARLLPAPARGRATLHPEALPNVGALSAVAALLRIAALLDRPNTQWFGEAASCKCADCVARGDPAFDCAVCGFSGAPYRSPCECRHTRAYNIAFCQGRLADIDAGELPKPGEFSHEYLADALQGELARPDRACLPGSSGTCGHGDRWCPTCGCAESDAETGIDAAELAHLIRDVRRVLREAGAEQ
jgi:hypothetical protein